jgi:hypothetical protein
MIQFILHVLSLIATSPTEKAELAVGRIVIKYAQRGMLYAATSEGKSDIATFVELAKDFGATELPATANPDATSITLPATPDHPKATYAYSTRDGIGGHLMAPGT